MLGHTYICFVQSFNTNQKFSNIWEVILKHRQPACSPAVNWEKLKTSSFWGPGAMKQNGFWIGRLSQGMSEKQNWQTCTQTWSSFLTYQWFCGAGKEGQGRVCGPGAAYLPQTWEQLHFRIKSGELFDNVHSKWFKRKAVLVQIKGWYWSFFYPEGGQKQLSQKERGKASICDTSPLYTLPDFNHLPLRALFLHLKSFILWM